MHISVGGGDEPLFPNVREGPIEHVHLRIESSEAPGMPDETDIGEFLLFGSVDEGFAVEVELVIGGSDGFCRDGFGEEWGEGKEAFGFGPVAGAAHAFEHIIMPTVAGVFAKIWETVVTIVGGLIEWSGEREVWSPQDAADVGEAGFLDELEDVGCPAQAVRPTASGSESDAGMFGKNALNGLSSAEDFGAQILAGDARATERLIAEHAVRPGVGGYFKEGIVKQATVGV